MYGNYDYGMLLNQIEARNRGKSCDNLLILATLKRKLGDCKPSVKDIVRGK